MLKCLIVFQTFLIINGFFYINQAVAEETDQIAINKEQQINVAQNDKHNIFLDQATIQKGYTVNAFNNTLKLSLVPEILNQSTEVKMEKINNEMEMPWRLNKISAIYQFEFVNKNTYDNHKPFYIQFSYDQKSNNYKQVFFYDKNYTTWRPLPTKDYPEQKFVRSLIHLPFARIAVFEYPEILTTGHASWYNHKSGNFAASPDFPKDSILRVYNAENNKFVDVKVNDYGPDRNLYPDRVIDLDKIAFSKIASFKAGIINVKIEPLYIAPNNNGIILNIPKAGAGFYPNITAKSAIIMNEKDEKILWSKNATTTLPLASLTKLVAVKVFLDTRPSLNQIVTYKIEDEEYNYKYCNKWESARVKLNNNEQVTIENLIYSSLIGSANNTIETLVRVSGLDRNVFINKMNETVKTWGTQSTYFVEPTGLSPKNVSSVNDYAIITKNVFTNPIIEKVSAMPKYVFSTINTKKEHKIKNTNKLIIQKKFNIIGSKTGYLNEAGHCLMVRVKINNKQFIIVTFGAESGNVSVSEMEELIEYVKHITHNT